MNRYAHAIYCDDIRHEVGNKQSLVGVYQGKMFVPSFPVVVPKLCIAVWIVTPAGNPFTKLILRLLFGDKVFLESPLPDQLLRSQGDELERADDAESRIFVIHTGLQISPLPLDGPITLKLRIETDQKELKAGGLEVELAAQANGQTRTQSRVPVVGPVDTTKS